MPRNEVATNFTDMFLDVAFEPSTPVISSSNDLLLFLPIGYFFTALIEAPVLFALLPRALSWRERLFAGFWLTACTYPIVVLVLPIVFSSSPRSVYLLVAEVFAPLAECVLFWLAFRKRLGPRPGLVAWSFVVIVLANVLSFVLGEVAGEFAWFGLLS